MRIVLDTNILVAAFIAHGSCAELVEHVLSEHEVYSSDFILGEFQKVLFAKFRVNPAMAAASMELLRSRMKIVSPSLPNPPLCRDSDDGLVLGTAAAGQCRYIVTGDKDLLPLSRYQDIFIISPREFWALLK